MKSDDALEIAFNRTKWLWGMKIEVHTLLCGLSLQVMREPEPRLLSLLAWVGLYLPSPTPSSFSLCPERLEWVRFQ